MLRGLIALLLVASLASCGKSQTRQDVEAYSSAVCEKEGFAKDSPEHRGCVTAKVGQALPRRNSTYIANPVQVLH